MTREPMPGKPRLARSFRHSCSESRRSVELDAELAAHARRATVAADQILRGDLLCLAAFVHRGGDRARVLLERQELAAVTHRHARNRLDDGFQQRFERVLRDELIGFERQGAVIGLRNLLLRRVDRRIGQVQKRRIDHRRDDEHVHRHPRGQALGADGLRDSHAPVDFHGACVAALHFWPHMRLGLLLDQRVANAAPSEVESEREADRAGADNKNWRVHERFGVFG